MSNEHEGNVEAITADIKETPEVGNRSSWQIEIFVGNLRPDLDQNFVNRRLQMLFSSRGIKISDGDFSVLRRGSKKAKHLFVVLKSEEDRRELIDTFNGLTDLDFIVENRSLRVKEKKCHSNKLQKIKKKKELPDSIKDQQKRSKTVDSKLGFSKSAPTMTTKMTTHRPFRFEGRVLRFGQILENESRRTEYKRGGGRYMKKILMNHVRRYICSFLNSEGGKLHIGVADNGKVYGVPCTRKQEDSIRILIDNIISKFQPPVFPNMYSVRFIPVVPCDADYNTDDCNDQCFKVLEIEVYNQPMTKSLYETDRGNVYIRRDGSVQGPLKASQIIAWCRLHQVQTIDVQNQQSSETTTSEGPKKDTCDTSDFQQVKAETLKADEPISRINELEESMKTRQAELEKEINSLRLSYETREKLLQDELEKSRFELQKRRRPSSAVCIIL